MLVLKHDVLIVCDSREEAQRKRKKLVQKYGFADDVPWNDDVGARAVNVKVYGVGNNCAGRVNLYSHTGDVPEKHQVRKIKELLEFTTNG